MRQTALLIMLVLTWTTTSDAEHLYSHQPIRAGQSAESGQRL